MFEAPDIPGAPDVIAWFGHWPTFHDAEVLSITLNRAGESRVVIHVSELTRHAIVTFCLEGFPQDREGVTNTRIDFFNYQNVLSSASVKKATEGYELVLSGIFGVDGSIVSERMSVKLEPGIPQDSSVRPRAEN